MSSRETSELLASRQKSATPESESRTAASRPIRVASDDVVMKAIKRISRDNRKLIEALAK